MDLPERAKLENGAWKPALSQGTVGDAVRAGRLTAEELENLDVLLDAPQLDADNLVLEIGDLQLGGALRIGRVRLEAESLDARLFLNAKLDEVVDLVDRLLATFDLSLTLFWAPVYNFNLAATAAYKNLETARGWFELPLRMVGNPDRPARLPAGRKDPLMLGNPEARLRKRPAELRRRVRRAVGRDGTVIVAVLDEAGAVVEEKIVGVAQRTASEGSSEGNGSTERSIGQVSRTVRRSVDGSSGNIIERTVDGSGRVIAEEVLGNVADLPVEEEYTDDDGRLVRRVRDESGALIEHLLDEEENTLDVRVRSSKAAVSEERRREDG